MIRARTHGGDLLVMNRSLTPGNGSVVIAAVEGNGNDVNTHLT
jgi:SOS-response transcriptional repressor LexA